MENNAQQNKTWLLDKLCASLFSQVSTEEVYQPVSEEEFQNLTPGLPEIGIVMIGLFCVENFEETPGFTLLYVLERRGYSNFVILQRALPGKEATSIAGLFPSACWFEREIQDGFGIEFRHSFDKRRLFLHEAYPYDFHPMLKSFQNRDITPIRQEVVRKINYIFKEVKGEGIYQIPVGPVHAGIIEPGHFRFSVIGETIMNLELRMFYKHRGIEKLAEGKTPAECLSLAESISGDESMANAVAFCAAIEKIAIVHISQRAWYLRTIFLEMERIYSHLGDLAGMLVDIAFPVGASDFFILREEVLRYNSILTGSRFLKNTVCPGGLRKNIPSKSLLPLDSYFNDFRDKLKQAVDYIHRSSSVIDRLETTGVIRKELINPLNITGPAARASGADLDTRLDHPYGLYPLPEEVKRTAKNGDVLARFDVKAREIEDSVSIIRKLIEDIPDGDPCINFKIKDGCALSLVEAARGQNLHWVYIRNGKIDRYKVRTASFCNWQAIEHAVIGNIVPDFPLINKSLNLSYAGTDL